jgi:alkylhydroperoxidase/carboxymuconolactone decarboxylase family protein YurZ
MMKTFKHLAQLSALVSTGSEQPFRHCLKQALAEDLPLESVVELLLQSSVFVGVPRCLNAFRLLHDVVGDVAEQLPENFNYQMSEPHAQGVISFEKVYGDKTDLLRTALKKWHPTLEHWIIENAYGQWLSRPFMPLVQREVCALASLTAQNLPLQLWGHMKGAIANGLSLEELKEILKSLEPYTAHTDMAFEQLERLK